MNPEFEYQRVEAAIRSHFEQPAGMLNLAAIAALEDAADAAQADGLTTAAEVIYDLRARAKELRKP